MGVGSVADVQVEFAKDNHITITLQSGLPFWESLCFNEDDHPYLEGHP